MFPSSGLARLPFAALALATLWLGWQATRLEVESDNRSLVVRLLHDYVRRNMRLIVADSFAVDEASLDRLTSPLRLRLLR